MAKSKNVIRFAVGTPERHGPVWRLWHSGAGRDELYVGVRTLVSELKASLHMSGDFRWAFTDVHVASDNALVTPDRRVIERWRPLEVQPGAWRCLTILQPWSSVNMTYELPASVQFLSPPAEGHEKVVHVAVARAGATVSANAELLKPVRLPSGATAWAFAIEREMEPELVRLVQINDHRADKRGQLRVLLMGIDDAGVGFLREVGSDGYDE